MTPREIMAALSKPFDPDAISWRVGPTTKDKSKGQALAYLDARDVQARLDEVMGIDWQCEYVPMANGTCCCRIGLLIDGQWRWRSNGAGVTDVEGDKGQYSDAFKRAAVMWGIGTYLYNTPSPWLELDEYKRFKPGQEGKLRAALTKASPAAKLEPQQPPNAALLAVTRGSAPETPPEAPPAPAPTPAATTAAKTQAPLQRAPAKTTDRAAQVSEECKQECLAGLADVYTAGDLELWEKNHGKDKPFWSRMSPPDRQAVLAVWQHKKTATKPKGAVNGVNR